jgi:hypothetical protein
VALRSEHAFDNDLDRNAGHRVSVDVGHDGFEHVARIWLEAQPDVGGARVHEDGARIRLDVMRSTSVTTAWTSSRLGPCSGSAAIPKTAPAVDAADSEPFCSASARRA